MYLDEYFPRVYFDETYFTMGSSGLSLSPTKFIIMAIDTILVRVFNQPVTAETQEIIYQDRDEVVMSNSSLITVPYTSRKVVVK